MPSQVRKKKRLPLQEGSKYIVVLNLLVRRFLKFDKTAEKSVKEARLGRKTFLNADLEDQSVLYLLVMQQKLFGCT